MRLRSLLIACTAMTTLALAPGVARAGDPTTSDCLNANEAAIRFRSQHKLRDARAQLLICSAATCPQEVRDVCMQHVMQVNQAMPTVVFEAKSPGGDELIDVKVSMDGEVVATKLEGTAVSLDPGRHEFTFEAAGQPSVKKVLVIHEGEKDRREVVVFGGAAAVPAPAPQTGPSAGPSKASPAPSAPAPASVPSPTRAALPSPAPTPITAAAQPPADAYAGHAQRTWGLFVGGVGVAGLAVGSAFGLMASSAWSSAQNECPMKQGCSQQATNDRGSALGSATVSTVSFIAGGALLAAGTVLYFTAPRAGAEQGTRVGLSVGPASIGMRGAF